MLYSTAVTAKFRTSCTKHATYTPHARWYVSQLATRPSSQLDTVMPCTTDTMACRHSPHHQATPHVTPLLCDHHHAIALHCQGSESCQGRQAHHGQASARHNQPAHQQAQQDHQHADKHSCQLSLSCLSVQLHKQPKGPSTKHQALPVNPPTPQHMALSVVGTTCPPTP